MRKWILTCEAERDLDHVLQNVVEYSYSYASAERLMNALHRKIQNIAEMPGIGRMRDEPNVRETFCRGYRIVYEVVEGVVYIKTIIHSRMCYPRPA